MAYKLAGGLEKKMREGTLVVEANPYAIRRTKVGFKLFNKLTGHVKGTHRSKSSAMRQFNLLEGIEHGNWRSTKH
jgi:hypothetical protein